MVRVTDILYLLATVSAISGAVFLVLYILKAVSQGIDATKTKLAEKGVDVSRGGMTVKTQGRLDRESYVDATQRGLVNAFNHSSFNRRRQTVDSHRPSASASSSVDLGNRSKHTSSSSLDLSSDDSKSKKKWRMGRHRKD